jgi:hypothetical protein
MIGNHAPQGSRNGDDATAAEDSEGGGVRERRQTSDWRLEARQLRQARKSRRQGTLSGGTEELSPEKNLSRYSGFDFFEGLGSGVNPHVKRLAETRGWRGFCRDEGASTKP